MTLDQATALEYEWLAKQPCGGSMEQRHALNQRMGMYEAWQSIFQEYVVLSRQGNLEALKRALFLYWYSWAEPNQLSGILCLDENLVEETLQMIDDLARNGELDKELKWMLPHYYEDTSLYLDHLWRDQFPYLHKASEETPDVSEERCLDASYDARGQLGEYWKRIQDFYQEPEKGSGTF